MQTARVFSFAAQVGGAPPAPANLAVRTSDVFRADSRPEPMQPRPEGPRGVVPAQRFRQAAERCLQTHPALHFCAACPALHHRPPPTVIAPCVSACSHGTQFVLFFRLIHRLRRVWHIHALTLSHAYLHVVPAHTLLRRGVPSLSPLTAANRDFLARVNMQPRHTVRSVAQSYPPLPPRFPHSFPPHLPVSCKSLLLPRCPLRFPRTHPFSVIHRLRHIVTFPSA